MLDLVLGSGHKKTSKNGPRHQELIIPPLITNAHFIHHENDNSVSWTVTLFDLTCIRMSIEVDTR